METEQYIDLLQSGVDAGYTRSALEIMFGVPRNDLSNILSGRRPLSNPSKRRIDNWFSGRKEKAKAKFMLKEVKEPEFESKTMIGVFEATFTSPETADYLSKIENSTPDECQLLASEINNSPLLSRRDKVLLTLKVNGKVK
jgi:hypothetical protein